MIEKNVIVDYLKKSIHGILKGGNQEIILDSTFTQNLCSAIEAFFLHGYLKVQSNKLFAKLGRSKPLYDYEFWSFIQEFIPKNLFITSDNDRKFTPIGYCRVWLRNVINEATILSYLEIILKDKRRLEQFYSKDSLIRDVELVEDFYGLLKSIEHLCFNLDTQSSLLNTWANSDALKISGLVTNINVSFNNSIEDFQQAREPTDDYSTDNFSVSGVSLQYEEDEEILATTITSIRPSCSVPEREFIASTTNLNITDDQSEEERTNYDTEIDPQLEADLKRQTLEFLSITTIPDVSSLSNVITDITIPDKQKPVSNHIDSSFTLDKPIAENNVELIIPEKLPSFPTMFEAYDGDGMENRKTPSSDDDNANRNLYVETKDTSVAINRPAVESNSESMLPEELPSFLPKFETDNDGDMEKRKNQPTPYERLWSECHLSSDDDLLNGPDTTIKSDYDAGNNVEQNEEIPISGNEDISETIKSGSSDSKVYSSLKFSRIVASTSDFVHQLIDRRFYFNVFKVKESDQPWELIGDEFVARNIDMKKLLDIFPGANVCTTMNGENSVFGGGCAKCGKTLSAGSFLDNYSGELYCIECEQPTRTVIPRDVIQNWDFTVKVVSNTTKRFLSEIMVHPNINLECNSALFESVPELARVRRLRHKLSLLWLQVTSCNIDVSNKMRESMFPRDYMLGNVDEKDLYSLEDLIILQNGVLEKTLNFVINKIALPHVSTCSICRMKAMPCDKCRDQNKLIFIHDIDNFSKCTSPSCQSVVHLACKNRQTKSFFCRRCVQFLEKQESITLTSYDTANSTGFH